MVRSLSHGIRNPMPLIIDAHLDLAYNALSFQRNYLLAAAQTRQSEQGSAIPQRNGHTLLGWPDMQRGQVALVFGTLFLTPRRYARQWETQAYADAGEAHVLYEQQLTYYRRLTEDHPDQFQLVFNQGDLRNVLEPWGTEPAYLPAPGPAGEENEPDTRSTLTHPVGIVLLLEGTEGIRSPQDIEFWWDRGVRIAGPVWAGIRFCGGTYEPGGFTHEGLELLEIMGGLGMTLDISHMNEASALQALDRYEGRVVATHANARALLKGIEGERHLTDQTILRLIERDGMMGIIPFNRFLYPGWTSSDDRQKTSLRTVAAHIDHVCQLAGDARHVGIGSDFDGGFGWPAVPQEVDTISDLQKLAQVLQDYGYNAESIADILSGNWRRQLERSLPGS